MNCYVCGTPRPEGARYCPGCGRYCADDPNVKNIRPIIPPAELIPEEPAPEPVIEESPVADAFEETVSHELPGLTEQAETVQPEVSPVSVPVSEPVPEIRKKKRRPLLLPTLIMGGLFLVGTVCYALFPYDTPAPADPVSTVPPIAGESTPVSPTEPTESTKPSQNKPGVSGYNFRPTNEKCFRIENGAVSIIPARYDGSPILVIPKTINGQTVTAIADSGFAGLEDVTTLILPETVETIGEGAFENCKDLRGVYFPDSVKTIGKNAFRMCQDMESVSIPAGVVSIGADAFDGCASLMYIFYEGDYESWMALYNEYITPYTYACCADGDYYHGAYRP